MHPLQFTLQRLREASGPESLPALLAFRDCLRESKNEFAFRHRSRQRLIDMLLYIIEERSWRSLSLENMFTFWDLTMTVLSHAKIKHEEVEKWQALLRRQKLLNESPERSDTSPSTPSVPETTSETEIDPSTSPHVPTKGSSNPGSSPFDLIDW